MKKNIFDVLVVYSESLADSASLGRSVKRPFGKRTSSQLYNEVYGYFMKVCQEQGLTVAFTTSADIIGAGLCQSYWLYDLGKWKKYCQMGYAEMIFDKFAPTTPELTKRRNLLFSKSQIKPFNKPSIYQLFLDKYKTFAKLQSLTIPTVMIKNNTLKELAVAQKHLKQMMEDHPKRNDFSDDIIMKDRYGAGGNNIYRFQKNQEKDIFDILQKNNSRSFIIQPFTKFNKGFKYQDQFVSADIRLIFLQGEIVQTYVRMAKQNSYLCNEHQGATLRYLKKEKIPKKVMTHAKKILKVINKKTSLFALDFIISNDGNPYLLEGNTGPGLDWNPSIQKNVDMSKQFIQMIVDELGRLIDNSLPNTELNASLNFDRISTMA